MNHLPYYWCNPGATRMKQGGNNYGEIGDDEEYSSIIDSPTARRMSTHVYKGFKGAWKELDNQYLKNKKREATQ